MVNEIITHQVEQNIIQGLTVEKAMSNFNKAIAKGIVKVMNKIGISTLHSYEEPRFSKPWDSMKNLSKAISAKPLPVLKELVYMRSKKKLTGVPQGI